MRKAAQDVLTLNNHGFKDSTEVKDMAQSLGLVKPVKQSTVSMAPKTVVRFDGQDYVLTKTFRWEKLRKEGEDVLLPEAPFPKREKRGMSVLLLRRHRDTNYKRKHVPSLSS